MPKFFTAKMDPKQNRSFFLGLTSHHIRTLAQSHIERLLIYEFSRISKCHKYATGTLTEF